MTDDKTTRIQYLTKKAQLSVISTEEQNELAELLGHNPQEFQGTDGLKVLISIALVVIAFGILIWMLENK